jgi:hypothetical protein
LENLVHEKEDELEEGERFAIVGMFFYIFHGNQPGERNADGLTMKSISPSCIYPPCIAPSECQQYESVSSTVRADCVSSSPNTQVQPHCWNHGRSWTGNKPIPRTR